jgi:CRISPR-associated endonuclease Cas2
MSAGLFVIVYDVTSDPRRDRLFHMLKEYGVPLQKSAFEARLTELERRSLLARAERILDWNVDRFTCYAIGREQEQRTAKIGPPRPELPDGEVVII